MKYAVGGLLALLVLAGVVAVCMRGRDRAVGEVERAVEAGSNEVRRAGGVPVLKRTASRRKSGSRRRMDGGGRTRPAVEEVPESVDDDDMSPADRQLMEAIEQGQSDEDLEQLVKIIPEVSASTNAEVSWSRSFPKSRPRRTPRSGLSLWTPWGGSACRA